MSKKTKVFICGTRENATRASLLLDSLVEETTYTVTMDSDGFGTHQGHLDELYLNSTAYEDFLERPDLREATKLWKERIDEADVVCVLLPCTQDDDVLYGYALGKEKVLILVGEPTDEDAVAMHILADAFVNYTYDVHNAIEQSIYRRGWLKQHGR